MTIGRTTVGFVAEKGKSLNVDCSLLVEGAKLSGRGSVNSKSGIAVEKWRIHFLENSARESIEQHAAIGETDNRYRK